MGFFGGLGKIIAGKPVFEDPGAPAALPTAANKPEHVFVDEHGNKIIPEIEIAHVHNHRDGEHLTVTVWANNRSNERVRIDSSYVLNQKQQFNRELTPGQARELVLYNGPTPHDDHNHRAELIFRLMADDDLFKIVYHVTFTRESDGGFLINELHHDGPTRDI